MFKANNQKQGNKQMEGEGMSVSDTLYFKGSKRHRLIKQQTLIKTQQQSLIKYTRMDTQFDKKVKTKIDMVVLK